MHELLASKTDEEQRRYKMIFSSSVLLLVLYACAMVFVLCKIKGNVQTNAIVLMFAFLIPFCTKTIADGLRVYQDQTNPLI